MRRIILVDEADVGPSVESSRISRRLFSSKLFRFVEWSARFVGWITNREGKLLYPIKSTLELSRTGVYKCHRVRAYLIETERPQVNKGQRFYSGRTMKIVHET